MMTLAEEQTNIKSVDPDQLANLIENSKTHKSLSNWDKTLDGISVAQCSSEDTAKFLDKYFISDIDNAFVDGNYETIPIKERKVYGTNVSNAFKNAGLKEVDEFSAPYATNASGMFSNNENLTSVSNIDLTKAEDVTSLFENCENLATVSNIKLENATNVSKMFKNCQNLPTKFPICLNLSAITSKANVAEIFEGSSVTELDVLIPTSLNDLKNLLQLQDFSSSIELVNIYNENNELYSFLSDAIILTNDNYKMSIMYPTTYNTMTSIDSEIKFDASQISSLSSMFYNCNKLLEIPLIKNTTNVTNMGYMFQNCSSLTTVPQLDTTNVTNIAGMFNGCSSLTAVPQLDTTNVTSMYDMFNGCSSLTAVPQLDTTNVTDMGYMFQNCSSLTTVPQLDTTNVTNMGNMFCRCSSLTAVPQLDTSNVTSMSSMFYGCSSLTTIDWTIDFSKIKSDSYVNNMFYLCSRIDSVKVKNISSSILSFLNRKYPNITFTVVTE